MTQQVAQLSMFGLLDTGLGRVFKTAEIKNKDGVVVGCSMGPKSKKEIASAYGLKVGKNDAEKLRELMLKDTDGAFTLAKQYIAGLNGEHTLHKFKVKTMASGIDRLYMEVDKVSRSQQLSDEKLGEQMFPAAMYPAMTLEEKVTEIRAARERQESHLAANLIEEPKQSIEQTNLQ